MMKMRSFLPSKKAIATTTAVVIAVIVILVAGGAGAYYYVSTLPPPAKVTITFWHTYQYSGELQALNESIAAFEQTFPYIDVVVAAQPYDPSRQKFIVASQGGQAPDVFRIANDWLGQFVDLGFVQAIDDRMSSTLQSRYIPTTLDAMVYKGKTYGLPASFDNLMLIYNKDIISTPPTTTDELISMAQANTNAAQGKYGLAFDGTTAYTWFPWQYGYGGSLFGANDQPTVNDTASVDALEFYVGLQKDLHVMSDQVDYGTMMSLFTAGKVAMIINGPWAVSDIRTAGIDFGIANIPKVSSTEDWPAPLVGVKGYIMSPQSQHKDEAFKLMDYLTSDQPTYLFQKYAGTVPSVQAVYDRDDVSSDPVTVGVAEQAKVGQPFPNRAEMGFFWDPLGNAITKYRTGALTAEAALDEAEATILQQIAQG
jgi:arabinogalactan oligomer/maltooligosaccharide transport system substrate-binding protein